MASPAILRSATPEEQKVFTWLDTKEGLLYEQDFLFFPLLLGGINLGFLPVDFYIRAGIKGFPLGWRVRPRPTGNERTIEASLIQTQEQQSTAEIVRINNENVQSRIDMTLRRAMNGEEVSGT